MSFLSISITGFTGTEGQRRGKVTIRFVQGPPCSEFLLSRLTSISWQGKSPLREADEFNTLTETGGTVWPTKFSSSWIVTTTFWVCSTWANSSFRGAWISSSGSSLFLECQLSCSIFYGWAFCDAGRCVDVFCVFLLACRCSVVWRLVPSLSFVCFCQFCSLMLPFEMLPLVVLWIERWGLVFVIYFIYF